MTPYTPIQPVAPEGWMVTGSKVREQIDSLYRNARPRIALTVVGLFLIQIILVFAAPLGIV